MHWTFFVLYFTNLFISIISTCRYHAQFYYWSMLLGWHGFNVFVITESMFFFFFLIDQFSASSSQFCALISKLLNLVNILLFFATFLYSQVSNWSSLKENYRFCYMFIVEEKHSNLGGGKICLFVITTTYFFCKFWSS